MEMEPVVVQRMAIRALRHLNASPPSFSSRRVSSIPVEASQGRGPKESQQVWVRMGR